MFAERHPNLAAAKLEFMCLRRHSLQHTMVYSEVQTVPKVYRIRPNDMQQLYVRSLRPPATAEVECCQVGCTVFLNIHLQVRMTGFIRYLTAHPTDVRRRIGNSLSE